MTVQWLQMPIDLTIATHNINRKPWDILYIWYDIEIFSIYLYTYKQKQKIQWPLSDEAIGKTIYLTVFENSRLHTHLFSFPVVKGERQPVLNDHTIQRSLYTGFNVFPAAELKSWNVYVWW